MWVFSSTNLILIAITASRFVRWWFAWLGQRCRQHHLHIRNGTQSKYRFRLWVSAAREPDIGHRGWDLQRTEGGRWSGDQPTQTHSSQWRNPSNESEYYQQGLDIKQWSALSDDCDHVHNIDLWIPITLISNLENKIYLHEYSTSFVRLRRALMVATPRPIGMHSRYNPLLYWWEFAHITLHGDAEVCFRLLG